eukprot:IDg20501t1
MLTLAKCKRALATLPADQRARGGGGKDMRREGYAPGRICAASRTHSPAFSPLPCGPQPHSIAQ